MVTYLLFLYTMKGAASLYHTLTTDLRQTFETHPAFTGRKPRYKLAVLLLLGAALGIISYSSAFLFS